MNTIDFAPLKLDSENFWFWSYELEGFDSDGDEHTAYKELSLSKEGKDVYTLEYRDNNCCIDIWEGNIPDRAFFESLLKNSIYTNDIELK